MDKQGVYGLLESEGIPFEATEHVAVWNMEDLARVDLPYPGRDAKNLFVRDDKKRAYYLITVMGSKRVDLKEFRNAHGTRALSFASDADLESILGLFPGAVTPFGLLNDSEHRVELFVDSELLEGPGIVGVHPNDNTATVWLRTEDLVRLLESRGTKVSVVMLRCHRSRLPTG
ncbi:MAG: prolyl-tRNA synthetase associated domain-containing protein [Thermoplasmata archaeon]|nr:prolyl-tRNA synthetase associated domain-containing protein [Thermoplasmata archaeon]